MTRQRNRIMYCACTLWSTERGREGGREGGVCVRTFGSGSKTNWKSWKRMSTMKSTAAKMIRTVCEEEKEGGREGGREREERMVWTRHGQEIPNPV